MIRNKLFKNQINNKEQRTCTQIFSKANIFGANVEGKETDKIL